MSKHKNSSSGKCCLAFGAGLIISCLLTEKVIIIITAIIIILLAIAVCK